MIDIALDTFPWSGHTTACEGLWMGVPIITLRGNRCAGRMVASVLSNIGLSEFVAESQDEYIAAAKKLPHDTDKLKALRSSLRATMQQSVLCDGKTFTKHLEGVYQKLWNDKISK
jgi:predicted O-linked N-acetylglucosamine transferase (SPINDLY family)